MLFFDIFFTLDIQIVIFMQYILLMLQNLVFVRKKTIDIQKILVHNFRINNFWYIAIKLIILD